MVQKWPLFVNLHTIQNVNAGGKRIGGQKSYNLVNVVCERTLEMTSLFLGARVVKFLDAWKDLNFFAWISDQKLNFSIKLTHSLTQIVGAESSYHSGRWAEKKSNRSNRFYRISANRPKQKYCFLWKNMHQSSKHLQCRNWENSSSMVQSPLKYLFSIEI